MKYLLNCLLWCALTFLITSCSSKQSHEPPSKKWATCIYFGADWGSRLVKPAQNDQPAVYDEEDQVVYFIKDMAYGDIIPRDNFLFWKQKPYRKLQGRRGALCWMRKDGSDKTEIAEIWTNPDQNIYIPYLEGFSMDLCPTTKKIAFAIQFGGEALSGLWTVNMDGSEPKIIIPPTDGRICKVSWHPSGKWLLFDQYDYYKRSTKRYIYRCDPEGNNLRRWTKEEYSSHPSYSPDGTKIAYSVSPLGMAGGPIVADVTNGPLTEKYNLYKVTKGHLFLHIMNSDGTDSKPLFQENIPHEGWWRENDKPVQGYYPLWSPDASQIGFRCGVYDNNTKIYHRVKGFCAPWGQWGINGLVGWGGGGIFIRKTPEYEMDFILKPIPSHNPRSEISDKLNLKDVW